MGKLTSNGKHIIKVGHHPQLKMLSKSVIMRRIQMQNIKNASEIQRPATYNNHIYMYICMYVCMYVCMYMYICMYVYDLLYKNLRVTTNQKSKIDTQKVKAEAIQTQH